MNAVGKKLAHILKGVSEKKVDVPLVMQWVAELALMERERCAKVADDQATYCESDKPRNPGFYYNRLALEIAAKIRAGQNI